ncbi:MAG: hypothetical protein GF311_25445 [Candidatus Lokiarchaeota archaeon]|nr:hypothetical protein [Candidatus Lokiarchaeota archaeon]
MGKDKETFVKWNRELHVLENICDLEIDVVTSETANFDEIIPSVDGIIYFMNPLDKQERELFQIILDIFKKIKRDIPTILMYYNEDGILSFSTTELLEESWIRFPDYETFVNLHPKDFRQALHCLCSAMISGDNPLDLENAWLRFPILIMQANYYYKNRNFYEAAKSIKKAAFISNIFGREDYYIISEQAAYLYSQLNLFLEAAQIIEDVNNRKANEYKRLYTETMIREGNKLFNKGDYEFAARQYENAAQWSLIELKNKELIIKSFKLAINSWISACRVENAFTILERLPHQEIKKTLNELTEKVLSAADYLVSIGNLEAAREQLYISIHTYQREGLFEAMEKFTHKLVEILIKILEKNIKNDKTYDAKKTYDEIENMWNAFDVEKINLDEYLEQIIKQFLHNQDFGMATYLLNEINSLALKKELTEYSSEVEERNKEIRKEALQRDLKEGIDIIKSFMESENQLIELLNKEKLKNANTLIEKNQYVRAAAYLESHARELKNIGEQEEADQILCESLNVLLEGNQLGKFFNTYLMLKSDTIQREYLEQIFPFLMESIKELSEISSFEKIEDLLEKANSIYRDQMLYEHSRELSKLFITIINKEALNSIRREKSRSGINYAIELIKRANNISNAYLENYEPDLDELYKVISEQFIELGDLSSALSYLDKIEDKFYKKEVYNKLSSSEEEMIASRAKEVEATLKKKSLQERLSIIKKKSQDARLDKEFELRQRRGLKRAFFNEALRLLENEEYDKAAEIYKKTIEKMNDLRKYYLAAVSLGILTIIRLKQEEMKYLAKYVKILTSSNQLFLDTFPVLLVEYIIDLHKAKDQKKLEEALSFMEHLPLFDEETKLLYDILGIEFVKESTSKPEETLEIDKENLKKTINGLFENIKKDKQDMAKRKLMKKRYYEGILENLNDKEYIKAASAYIDLIPELIDKDFEKHAAVCLILSTLIFIFNEREEIAYTNVEELLGEHTQLSTLPEIKLLNEFLKVWQAKIDDLIQLSLSVFMDKLLLFEIEKNLMKSYIEQDLDFKPQQKPLSKEKKEEKSKKLRELDQKIDIINQKLKDNRSEFKEMFKKRIAMKKRYYNTILEHLSKEEFKEASREYLDLATKFAERKDYKMGSLMLLLYVICSKKSRVEIYDIKQNVESFMTSLGISRGIVSELFQLMMTQFIIDLIEYNINKFLPTINQMLRNLPLFEEEERLLPIEL